MNGNDTSKLVHHSFPNITNNRLRARSWCFTLFNYGPADIDNLNDLTFVYLVYGLEVTPTTNKKHLQGYVVFKDACSRKTMSTRIPRAFVCKARAGPSSNAKYCKKDGKWEQFGVMPMDQFEKGAANKSRYKKLWILSKLNMIDEIALQYPDLAVRHYFTILKVARDYANKPPDLKKLDNEWVWGKAATGKSHYAEHLSDNVYTKSCNKWWEGFQPNKHTIIHLADFGKEHSCLGHHIKIWFDLYSFPAERKNGGLNIRFKKGVVTSNYHPREIWPDDDKLLEAITRRFTIIHAERTLENNTFGYLFEASDDVVIESPVCPDAPIGPGPGETVFDSAIQSIEYNSQESDVSDDYSMGSF